MEQMKQIPVYRQTGMYAREHGELEQFPLLLYPCFLQFQLP